MRKLFWILLLGNAILFAAMQRGWLGWGEQEQQAQPALHGEMIHLLDASQSVPAKEPPGPARPPGPAPATVPVTPAPTLASARVVASPEPPTTMQLAQSISAPATGSSNTLVCLEWGDFSGPDLTRAVAALSALQLGEKLSQRQVERDIGYWVYIPPLRNKAAVNRKVDELKALGIREYFIIQSAGSWRNAISLGVFKTSEAAQNFLNHLRTKGVRTAKVGERASKLKATIFRLNRIEAATEAKLTVMQKDFAGSELKNVPCAH
jgi:hypothetical protein